MQGGTGWRKLRIESPKFAEECRFTDEEQMRSAFVRVLGIPPREYRTRFASARVVIAGMPGSMLKPGETIGRRIF